MKRMHRTIMMFQLAALGALAACSLLTGPGDSDLALARQRWALSNIRSYDFTASRSCFCTPQSLRPVTVSVTDGIVTQRVYADTGEPVPAADSEFSTVEALFDIIQAAMARHSALVDATYDPARGVPVTISIDGSFQIADDEVSYDISGFRAR